VEKIAAIFIERHAKPNTRPRSAAETERLLLKEIVPVWKGRRLSDIGKGDIHQLLDGFMDRDAPALANKVFGVFRKLCSWAVGRGLLTISPCNEIKAPKVGRARDRVLSDDELKSLWRAAESLGYPFAPLIQLLILLGQRRGEISGMHWSEINFDTRIWIIPRERAKNDQAHVAPLSPQAITVLENLPRNSELVFSTNGNTPVSGFSKVKTRLDALMPAGTPAWVIHDLRRSFASDCARLGIAVHVVEKALNHSSGTFRGIVSVYQKHDFFEEKRAAVTTWGNYIEILTNGTVNKNAYF
jgi:integrase